MHQVNITLLLVLLLLVGGLIGCAMSNPQGRPAGPPTVTVTTPLQQEVTDDEEFTGRTDAVESVQVRARVSGYLMAIDFRDGAEVREGAVLFEIDPGPTRRP
jgi:multidrug efflux pump subunit AcrA (membrane-fusion protein)